MSLFLSGWAIIGVSPVDKHEGKDNARLRTQRSTGSAFRPGIQQVRFKDLGRGWYEESQRQEHHGHNDPKRCTR